MKNSSGLGRRSRKRPPRLFFSSEKHSKRLILFRRLFRYSK